MNKAVPPSLEEVWKWKEETAKQTRDMSRNELIRFYRDGANAVLKKLGADLKSRPASADRGATSETGQ